MNSTVNLPKEAISICEEKIKEFQSEIETMSNFRNAGSPAEQWQILKSSRAAYTDFMRDFAKELFGWAEVKYTQDHLFLIANNYHIELPIRKHDNTIVARYSYGSMNKEPELKPYKEVDEYRKYASLLQKGYAEASKMLYPNMNYFQRMRRFKSLASVYRNPQHWLDKAVELEKDAEKFYQISLEHYNKYNKDKALFMEETYPLIAAFAGDIFNIIVN